MGHACHPDCALHGHTPEEYKSRLLSTVLEHGWAIQGILGSGGYAHTVGLTGRRWPELIYYLTDAEGTRTTLDTVGVLLNAIVQSFIDQELTPAAGVTLTVTGKYGTTYTCRFDTTLVTTPLAAARLLYGPKKVRALTVTVLDTARQDPDAP